MVSPFDKQRFVELIETEGCALVEGVFSQEFVSRAKQDLEEAIAVEAEYHRGRKHSDYGMVLLCSLYGKSFLEIFDNEEYIEGFNAVLGPYCIVYAYTSSSMPPGSTNYSRRIHVDCPRLIPKYVTNFGAMILLDDFTEENGATWFLRGSHTWPDAPSEEFFNENAERLLAPAGSVFYLNARLWHAGGENFTEFWRHSLTINMCRPWMKQRIDIPRAMSHMDLSTLSDTARQKLGFLAGVPASYDEYYAPFEQRKFRQPVE